MPDAKTDFNTNLPKKIAGDPESAKEIGAVFLFKINGDDGGVWTVNCKDELGVVEGEGAEADCTLEMESDDWETISDNPSAAMQLFFQGKLQVSGDPTLATKLQALLG